MKITRRNTIRLLGAGLGSALVGAHWPGLAQGTPAFPEPRLLSVRRPEVGLVEASLAARESNLTIGGKPVTLLTYGGLPGSTLRLREGETVRLHFTNHLAQVTNLHLHGLHVSPEVDDPLAQIQPGQSRMYEFTVPKGSAGTYWYHPHIHGRVAEQLYAGLLGLIVVEGPVDAMPELKGAEEHVLVLKDFAFSGSRIAPFTPMDWMNGKEGDLLTVNAAIRPILRAQRGTLRLRILNASNARYYRLALENHPLYLIATDGGFIEKPVELPELLLAPGERAEVLVRLTRAGSFRLQALPYDRGAMMMHGGGMGMMNHQGMMMGMGPSRLETLLTIVAPPNPKPLPLPTSLATVERLDLTKVVATRRFELGERMMQAEFFINGQMFDPSRVDVRARRGTLEVWELVNKTDMDHPFHLHTYPFQVLSINGRPQPYRAWKDTVNLKKNDVVRIAIPFRDFVGTTVYHCHIVEHEDRGMMGVLQVEG
ncbi:multicopper oxidase family protein [Meiothermus sp.]|uniref:multicopper oxidase family protein n=1 Tax=Meiothermus sp. TaxID=1955249 RepID=UPI00307EEA99